LLFQHQNIMRLKQDPFKKALYVFQMPEKQ